ncbi:hypothetical protein [Fusicatenibacter sp.]
MQIAEVIFQTYSNTGSGFFSDSSCYPAFPHFRRFYQDS